MPPKKIGRRNNAKRKGKSKNNNIEIPIEGDMIRMIARAKKRSGSGGGNPQITLICEDGIERLGIVRGKMTKKQFINTDDFLIVELFTSDGKQDKCSIIAKIYDKKSLGSRISKFNSFNDKVNDNNYIHESTSNYVWDNDDDDDNNKKESYLDIYNNIDSDSDNDDDDFIENNI